MVYGTGRRTGADCFLYLRKNDFGVKRILSPYTSRRNPVTAGGTVADQRGIGTKFIVIIDEWDVLIRDEAADLKTQEEYINFLRAMFKGTEPTKYIQLAYLTGILPVKKKRHSRR